MWLLAIREIVVKKLVFWWKSLGDFRWKKCGSSVLQLRYGLYKKI